MAVLRSPASMEGSNHKHDHLRNVRFSICIVIVVDSCDYKFLDGIYGNAGELNASKDHRYFVPIVEEIRPNPRDINSTGDTPREHCIHRRSSSD